MGGCFLFVWFWFIVPLEKWTGVAGFVVKLVPAEVIRQHMYFFILSYFVDNNFRN